MSNQRQRGVFWTLFVGLLVCWHVYWYMSFVYHCMYFESGCYKSMVYVYVVTCVEFLSHG
jgi:hypothetical protein